MYVKDTHNAVFLRTQPSGSVGCILIFAISYVETSKVQRKVDCGTSGVRAGQAITGHQAVRTAQ